MARMMSFLANRTGAEIPAAVNIDPSRDGHRRQPISLRSFGGEAARGLIGREDGDAFAAASPPISATKPASVADRQSKLFTDRGRPAG